jgi:hypothetical protein
MQSPDFIQALAISTTAFEQTNNGASLGKPKSAEVQIVSGINYKIIF